MHPPRRHIPLQAAHVGVGDLHMVGRVDIPDARKHPHTGIWTPHFCSRVRVHLYIAVPLHGHQLVARLGRGRGAAVRVPLLILVRVVHLVVQVHGLSKGPLPAVASLGVRPTVEDDGRMLLEVHIFDYDANCYGKLVRVEFLHKLRDEEKYTDLETLTDAIAADARAARDFFETLSLT